MCQVVVFYRFHNLFSTLDNLWNRSTVIFFTDERFEGHGLSNLLKASQPVEWLRLDFYPGSMVPESCALKALCLTHPLWVVFIYLNHLRKETYFLLLSQLIVQGWRELLIWSLVGWLSLSVLLLPVFCSADGLKWLTCRRLDTPFLFCLICHLV